MAMAASMDSKIARCYLEVSRELAIDILNENVDEGTYLLRPSTTCDGTVLCVREDNTVKNYLIKHEDLNGEFRYKIGIQDFPDLDSLLEHYTHTKLDTTTLKKPVAAPLEFLVCTMFDFEARDGNELSFSKGELLKVTCKNEPEWWTAKNSEDKEGLIPASYVVASGEGQASGSSL